jgi:hypothetical protein
MAGKSDNEVYTKTVVTRALGLVGEALTQSDFATAERLLAVAAAGSDRVLPKLRPEMRNQVEAERRRVQDYRQRFEAYRRAANRLRADPEDAEANLVVGRYLCLVNGDWEEGLPRLAKGTDVTLARLARLDLGRPEAPERQLGLGNGWQEAARLTKQEERLARAALFGRAHYWYKKALAQSPPGLQRGVERQVEDIERLARDLSPGLQAAFFSDLTPAKDPWQGAGRLVQAPVRPEPRQRIRNRNVQPDPPRLVVVLPGMGPFPSGGMAGGFGGYFRFGFAFRR